ncbi:hypothetical protein ACOME3_007651 [Neoechinorhynchus agilis]
MKISPSFLQYATSKMFDKKAFLNVFYLQAGSIDSDLCDPFLSFFSFPSCHVSTPISYIRKVIESLRLSKTHGKEFVHPSGSSDTSRGGVTHQWVSSLQQQFVRFWLWVIGDRRFEP